MKKGVNVIFGVDGQKIHELFKSRRFQRIQWNCPFGGTTTKERETFKQVIPNFFLSSSKLQLVGDRIHVTLMQEPTYWKVRQVENPIVLGATAVGYRLIRKRLFEEKRYPGYVHVKTGKSVQIGMGTDEREFVFEKTDLTPTNLTTEFASKLEKNEIKKFKINTDGKTKDLIDQYYECSSDEDSSDYYESD